MGSRFAFIIENIKIEETFVCVYVYGMLVIVRLVSVFDLIVTAIAWLARSADAV